MQIGFGYDVHKLVKGKKLIVGGVEIPYVKGLLGWSDGDVLIHALIDALLGALRKGDIGGHFPSGSPKYKRISSLELLKFVAELLRSEGFAVNNLDSTLVIQEPKLSPYAPAMKKKIAETLEIEEDLINIKFKTEEGLGFTGSKSGAKAYAVCLIHKEV